MIASRKPYFIAQLDMGNIEFIEGRKQQNLNHYSTF